MADKLNTIERLRDLGATHVIMDGDKLEVRFDSPAPKTYAEPATEDGLPDGEEPQRGWRRQAPKAASLRDLEQARRERRQSRDDGVG